MKETNTDEAQTQSVEDLEVLTDEAEEAKGGEAGRNGNLQITQFYYGAATP